MTQQNKKEIYFNALKESFVKLQPKLLWTNPVIFITEIGAFLTTVFILKNILTGAPVSGFEVQISAWLWFTVLFANFAEAVAEGRGKAQAEALKKTRTGTMARRLVNGKEESVSAAELRKGDVV
ncbi:MAG: potassium-transporting ATPase subunit B, partial [Bdellovibrionaceae bacterium]|nr:potassium-transporting ATPase subunit B [Pseudobdellovibrionaceae bacterium]